MNAELIKELVILKEYFDRGGYSREKCAFFYLLGWLQSSEDITDKDLEKVS